MREWEGYDWPQYDELKLKTLLSANCTTNSVNCVQHFRGRWILHGTNFGHISKMTGGDPAVDFISRLYHLAQAEKLTPQFV